MKLVVDHQQRFAKMRAHTAAHLLHAELAKIFSTTKQAGSFVDEDYVRFDFVADRLLSPEELVIVEKAVNDLIYKALPVDLIETSYDEAVKLGAKAFFEDKYGDVVRVVKVADEVSTELCGGTHVANTKDIGCFAIIGQETVASGVKRIVALTGPKVYEQVLAKDIVLNTLAQKFDVNSKQLVDKAEKFLKEYEDMKKTLESFESKIVTSALQSAPALARDGCDKIIKVASDLNFKTVAFVAKGLFADQNVLIYTQEGNFVILTHGVSAKELASKLGLKGGGSDTMVQGRDVKVVELFK